MDDNLLSSSTVGEKLKNKLPGMEKWLIIEWKAFSQA